ncbi:MAG: InlB B-repeat-containing protein [Lachnospiraceae bacterium]|nr:InlB B-repeat-containing protein [Lachnospiraceae bacterium]
MMKKNIIYTILKSLIIVGFSVCLPYLVSAAMQYITFGGGSGKYGVSFIQNSSKWTTRQAAKVGASESETGDIIATVSGNGGYELKSVPEISGIDAKVVQKKNNGVYNLIISGEDIYKASINAPETLHVTVSAETQAVKQRITATVSGNEVSIGDKTGTEGISYTSDTARKVLIKVSPGNRSYFTDEEIENARAISSEINNPIVLYPDTSQSGPEQIVFEVPASWFTGYLGHKDREVNFTIEGIEYVDPGTDSIIPDHSVNFKKADGIKKYSVRFVQKDKEETDYLSAEIRDKAAHTDAVYATVSGNGGYYLASPPTSNAMDSDLVYANNDGTYSMIFLGDRVYNSARYGGSDVFVDINADAQPVKQYVTATVSGNSITIDGNAGNIGTTYTVENAKDSTIIVKAGPSWSFTEETQNNATARSDEQDGYILNTDLSETNGDQLVFRLPWDWYYNYNGHTDRAVNFTIEGVSKIEKETASYTVTFRNGSIDIKKIIVKEGETIEGKEPAAPTGDGTFLGWYLGDEKWDSSTPVTKDIVLQAKYESTIDIPEGSRSGLDPQPLIEEAEGLAGRIYMVKGQSFVISSGMWSSANVYSATVGNKNGKITAKNEGIARIHNDDTNETYEIIVITPAVHISGTNKKNAAIAIGDSVNVDITGIADAYLDKYEISWVSSNNNVAQVTDGHITGLSAGSAQVSANICGKSYVCTIKVTDISTANLPKFYSADEKITLAPLQTTTLKYTNSVLFLKQAVWTSDNEMVEVVNSKGKCIGYADGVVYITTAGNITAIGPGISKLTGTVNGIQTVNLTVTVNNMPTSYVYLSPGKTKTLKYYKVTNSKAKYESSDPNSVSVSSKGLVKASSFITAGQVKAAEITCLYNPYPTYIYKTNGFVYKTNVYVENPVVKNDTKLQQVGVNKYNLYINNGSTYKLQIDGVEQKILWKSKKNDIAFVDENGTVFGRQSGKTTLTVKINNTTFTVNVYVM